MTDNNENDKTKILIVDDSSENLHSMMGVLRSKYAVIAATNGYKALELAARQPQPRLILLDIMMPEMDGYEVLRRLKSSPATADIPVMFVTSLSDIKDEALGLRLGAVDYISRPINPDLLMVRVMAQLDLSRYRQNSAGQKEKNDRTRQPHLLIVDDAPENIHGLVGALSDDYLIQVANNGPKAIEIALGFNPPDLILLDIVMPDMDGYEVCRQIKATERGRHIPIIFLSVMDSPDKKVLGFSIGAADYITKPFDVDEIRARVHTHLELSQLQIFLEQQVEQRTAALKATSSQLQATLNAIPDQLFEVNLGGRYLNVYESSNPSHQHIRVAMPGKRIADVLPEDAAAVCMAALMEADRKSVSIGKQFEIASESGTSWFELSVARKYDNISTEPRFIVLARDISERKHAQAALDAFNRDFEAFLNQTTDFIYFKDINCRFRFTSKTLATITGHAGWRELIGKHDKEIFPPDLADIYEKEDLTVLSEGRPLLNQIDPYNVVTGYRGHVITNKWPLFDSNGKVSGIFGISRDITERIAAEASLRESESNLKEAQKLAHIGSWVLDLETNHLQWSDEIYRIFEINPESFAATYEAFLDAVHPEDRDMVHNAYIESLRSHTPYQIEHRVLLPDGRVKIVTESSRTDYNKDGHAIRSLGTTQDITERKAAEKQIEHLAFYDPLTDLPNRRLLMDRLQQAITSSSRNQHHAALLFIDLDNFKNFNDTYGHDVGDELLKLVGVRLQSCVRQGDTVSRVGGDEFVVILKHLSPNHLEAATQTETIGAKIIASLARPYNIGMLNYQGTSSIGITLLSEQRNTAETLMKQADIAMYQAKNASRNTLRFFDPEMQANIDARVKLESHLRHSLENREFQLYYQIQVDSTNQKIGAEALIRWHHPGRGLVSPGDFIPLAEETGLILPIGAWVLETACAQLSKWQDDPSLRHLTLAVNVSAVQFRQNSFESQVKSIVERSGINPRLLKLELTESMLLKNVETTISSMNVLSKLGIRFSLDDFGTGYSSLQYLKQLPLNQIKIDQSFVSDVVQSGSDREIVKTIIGIAQGLKLDVIAEGVETEEQRSLLESMGCHNYQGYLFSKPVPVDDFEALLKQG